MFHGGAFARGFIVIQLFVNLQDDDDDDDDDANHSYGC